MFIYLNKTTEHSGDVKAAVQRAVRDVTIESSLKNCEEVWLSRTFDLRPHSRVILSKALNEDLASSVSGSHYTKGDLSRNVTTRGGSRRLSRQSDKGFLMSKKVGKGSSMSLYESLKHIEEPGTVVLLKSADAIFEELQHHQLVLSSIQPHAESGSFLDEVTKWQKKLKIIETSVQLWLMVQEKWAQLEEPLECRGPVETWLPQLVNSIKASLQHHLWAALEHKNVVTARRKEIHSAGARRVVMNKPTSKEESTADRKKSLTPSNKQDSTHVGPRQDKDIHREPELRHWVLSTSSDVVYLSTQIKFSRIMKECSSPENEHKEIIQDCLKDLTEGIEYVAKILNEIPLEDILQPSKRTSKAEREGNEQGQGLARSEDDHQLSLEDKAVVIAINNFWLPQLSADEASVLKSLVAAEWPSTLNSNYQNTSNDANDTAPDGLIPAVVTSKYGCGQQVASSECTEDTSVPNAIIKAIEKCHIFPSNTFVSKVSHLVQLALKYQTVVITGPPGCGKTKCIEAYMETLKEEKKIIKDTVFINALQPGHLLGFVNEESRWVDGLLARLLRSYYRQSTTAKGNQVNILHLEGELETLANINPSVLCCMGILAMPCTDIDWKLPLYVWIKTQAEEHQQQLQQLTDTFLEPCLQFLRENGILHQDGNSLDTTLKTLVFSEVNVAETFCRICTVWDYHIDSDTRQFVRWHDTLSCYFVSHGQSTASEAFVHTVHSEPLLYFSTLLTTAGYPVMLAGDAGCGKSMIVQEVLNSLCSGDVAEKLQLRIPVNNREQQLSIFSTILNTHFLPQVTESKAEGVATPSNHHLPELLTAIASVTVKLQERLRAVFLGTSQRCHYLFTLRDLAKIFRNICLSQDGSTTTDILLPLWRHECDWVYRQRMSSCVDQHKYLQEYTIATKKVFTSEEELQIILSPHQPLFSNIVEDDGGLITTVAKQQEMNLFRKTNIQTLDGYQQTFNFSHTEELLAEALREYNKVNPRMNITFYKSAVELLCRLTRNLRSPRGSAHTMLCGEGCVRSTISLARLAAHLSGFSVVQLGSYNKADKHEPRTRHFKSQLVDCYVKAGLKGQRTLLLLSEEEIDSTVLVNMTEFVVFGSVSHLFTSEQQATIANAMRNEVTNAGLTYSKENAWKLFLEAIQQNIRWLLIQSSTGPVFRKWCLEFHSLIDALNVYFIPKWSREYLVEHASYYIRELEMLTKEEKENICHLLSSMHLSIANHDKTTRGTHGNITNATFENFVRCFTVLAKEQYDLIGKNHELAKETLGHIEEKLKSHEKLTGDLLHQKTVLEEHKEGTLKILHQIAQDKAVVEQKIHVIYQQLQKIKKFRALLPEYQIAYEKAQYKCSTIIENINELVRHMDVRALGELRAMQKPDVDIEELMASVIIILKSPNTDLTWAKGAKRQMANIDRFLNELINFSNAKLPQSTLELLESNLKKSQFTPENMERKSGGNLAASSLLRWLQGAVRYYRILASKVKPLQSKVDEMTVALQEAEQKMTTLQQRKKALILRLSDLERGFEEATVHKNKQQQRTIEIGHKLEEAASIAQLLEDERRKYASVVSSLPERLSGVPGTTSMAAGLVSYLGAYEHYFRQLMLTIEWPMALKEKGFPLMIDSIDPVKGEECCFKENGNWYHDLEETHLNELSSQNQFLPIITEELYGDFIKALSTRIVKKSVLQMWTAKDWTPQQMENAAILSFSWQRPVLLIDPCFEGEQWVLEILETSFAKSFSSINLQARQDSSVLAPIEKGILSGCPLFLNNYSSKWDDLLMPLIDHCGATTEKYNQQGSSSIISFNGHRLLCTNQFKLFMASSELDPLFNIEICSGTTMINYSYSDGSLLELLLRRAFEKLLPDLHSQLMKTSNTILMHQESLNELEIRTRECFISSALNDTYDTIYITEIFNERKTVFEELEKAKATYTNLLKLRDKLYPLAHQGAMLYSVLKALRALAVEYYFSIEFFQRLFDIVIERNADSHETIEVEKVDFQTDSIISTSVLEDKKTGLQSQTALTDQHEEHNEREDTMQFPNGQEEFSSTAEVHNFSLSSNQIRKLMDQLTQAVYQCLIQSLLPEHSTQACAMLFLCIQQLENENAVTEEELAFFAQGSCSFEKIGWETIGSNINAPSWMPSERWEDLMILSIISEHFKTICAQITENSSAWENWYISVYQDDENTEVAKGSIAHLPECGVHNDFHQLLLIRAICPSRFPDGVSHYVARVSRDLDVEDLLPGVENLARLDENILGVLVILHSASNDKSSYSSAIASHEPQMAISRVAKEKDIPLFTVSMKKDNEAEVKAALSDAINQNGWLLIENLHLTPKTVLKNLYRSLTYAMKMQATQKAERQFCVWLISERGAPIPPNFVAQLKKVSWHFLLLNQKNSNVSTRNVTYIDCLPQLLSSAILSALEIMKANMCEKVNGSDASVQIISYGICVIHGILQTQKIYPRTGLTNMMDVGLVQLNQALNVVLSAHEKRKDPSEFAAAVEKGVISVYINLTLRPEDAAYVEALVHEIISCILQQKGIIINNITIPVPSSNVEPLQYSNWLIDNMPGKHSLQALILSNSAERTVHEKFALEFIQVLVKLYDSMKVSLPLLMQEDSYSGKDLTSLHISLERISEQLPPLIQINTDNVPTSASLNRHTAESELQASKHVLLQECRLMNSCIRNFRLSISELSKCLLNGLTGTPVHPLETAEALQKQEVPKSWVYSHSTHMGFYSINSWLQDLHKKHKQLKQWMKKGIMPFAKGEKGALTSVSLGSLFNPEALVLALRLQFAVHHGYSLHEVVLQCHIAEYPDYKPDAEEYSLYAENFILHGAMWDFKNNHLTESRNVVQALPFVIITPAYIRDIKTDDATGIYDCPVCTDCSMENRVMTLPLQCTKPVKQWHLRRVTITLNPDFNMRTFGMGRSSTVKEQGNNTAINTRTKMAKLSHSKIFKRASKMKDPDGLQTQQSKAPNSNGLQNFSTGTDDNLLSDKAHNSTIPQQNSENDMLGETENVVLSPLFINETISNQDDKEFFRGVQSGTHQNTSLSEVGDGKEMKAGLTEGKVLVRSESEDTADKAEDLIIREDLIVDTRISDYETSYNEHGQSDNNGDFDEAQNEGYKEDFDEEMLNNFEQRVHVVTDCDSGENQDTCKYGPNTNNDEHEFDYQKEGIPDNSYTTRVHSAKSENNEEIQESIKEHVGMDPSQWDVSLHSSTEVNEPQNIQA
ncbi:dynein beta chain, flagellar outer arm-like [Pelobates cultripes]|uniref:Dynein beta chain, flagellar outer arm-like n=1 Tax=Pelobates cultripes TaxID=61616 RepID=A0AAD1VN78_PELCU|nr:dynein beta chain, flagellar outer arm-like [Pelobates cultripes]